MDTADNWLFQRGRGFGMEDTEGGLEAWAFISTLQALFLIRQPSPIRVKKKKKTVFSVDVPSYVFKSSKWGGCCFLLLQNPPSNRFKGWYVTTMPPVFYNMPCTLIPHTSMSHSSPSSSIPALKERQYEEGLQEKKWVMKALMYVLQQLLHCIGYR